MVQVSATTVIMLAGVFARFATALPTEPRFGLDVPPPLGITVTITTTVTIGSCAASTNSNDGVADVQIETHVPNEQPDITPAPTVTEAAGGDDNQQCTSICAAPTITDYAPDCPRMICDIALCLPEPDVTKTSTINCPGGVCNLGELGLKTKDCDSLNLPTVTVTAPCGDMCGAPCRGSTTTVAVACGTSFMGEE